MGRPIGNNIPYGRLNTSKRAEKTAHFSPDQETRRRAPHAFRIPREQVLQAGATTTRGSRIVQEEAVNDFQSQHLVEFGSVVPIPLKVTRTTASSPFRSI